MHRIGYREDAIEPLRICVAILLVLFVGSPRRDLCHGCAIRSTHPATCSGVCGGDRLSENQPRGNVVEPITLGGDVAFLSFPRPGSGTCPFCGDRPFGANDSLCVVLEARWESLHKTLQSVIVDRMFAREVVALTALIDTAENHSVLRSAAARTLPLRL